MTAHAFFDHRTGGCFLFERYPQIYDWYEIRDWFDGSQDEWDALVAADMEDGDKSLSSLGFLPVYGFTIGPDWGRDADYVYPELDALPSNSLLEAVRDAPRFAEMDLGGCDAFILRWGAAEEHNGIRFRHGVPDAGDMAAYGLAPARSPSARSNGRRACGECQGCGRCVE
ncbi:MAG: hypothetical protein Q4P84_08630 [Elusimicrobiales bacterium]|nr:hypothetical protein [Elusimicrobiales bacterium]